MLMIVKKVQLLKRYEIKKIKKINYNKNKVF